MTTVSASSSSTSRCCYHVFLSFRGEDTRRTFTDHLYTALVHAGFRTFRDDDEIRRGENIKSELEKAIQESRISIIVFSKDYASSRWCLDELVMILEWNKKSSGHFVLPVFYDVDPSHVRKQMGSFEDAFLKHEERFLDHDRKNEWLGKVKGWREALREAGDLAGMNLQNQADGHEALFIQKIVKVVEDKLSRPILDVAPYLIGIRYRAEKIHHWLRDVSSEIGTVIISGMSGIGKTTIAKFLFNLNYSRFEGSSFLANVTQTSKREDGLLRLQKQLLSDILKGRMEKIHSVDEGIVKIKDAIRCKRVLVVLDDVDKPDQLYELLGMRDFLSPGSKIIITTRNNRLLRAHEVCNVYKVENLDDKESLELFSMHAFGRSHPIDDYMEESKRVVQHCGGLPLAIKVLGSSLSGKSLIVWKSHIEKLKAIPNNEILRKLQISYDCLQDDHDRDLFLHVACFFVGKNKDHIVAILDRCNFSSIIGIENLIDRCLLTIDNRNTLVMHKLLQEMGREIVRQESPKEPGERSRLWNHQDSFNVLRENTGTRKIEGLILDMHLLEEDNFAEASFDVNRKQRFDEFVDNSLLSNVRVLLKRNQFGIFSGYPIGTAPEHLNQVDLEVDAFATMSKLKFLQLNYVQLSGTYEKFPKGIRWLCWSRFPYKSIPCDFPLESLVALEMPHNNLKYLWNETKILHLLKILNLSHSCSLIETPDFSILPNLESLILEDCTCLVKVHESIGCLERLVLLNLKDCNNLRNLPRSIAMLKSLETLNICGCLNLENLSTELERMKSLRVFLVDGTSINQLLSTPGEVKTLHWFIQPSLLKPRKSPEISWASLPQSLVRLSLAHCNLSDDAFPEDLSNLSSLQVLNMSDNPICRLPNFIRDLPKLQFLYLSSCTRLRSVTGLPKLEELNVASNLLLEKISFLSFPSHFWHSDCDSLVEILCQFKLEPIENVDTEIINKFGFSNLGSMGNQYVKLFSLSLSQQGRKLPLQGCHEKHLFYVYLRESMVPPFFNLKSKGSSLSVTVPSHDPNFKIQGLSLCSVYALSNIAFPIYYKHGSVHTIISNTTKNVKWSHCPEVFGVPEEKEDMIMLSYWKFENQLEAGDEMNISVVMTEQFQVKELGVHLVYKEVEEEEEEIIQPYGNLIPGNLFTELGTKVYRLGLHGDNCDDCPSRADYEFIEEGDYVRCEY